MHTPTTANCFNQHVAAVLSPLLLLLLTASPLLARPRSPLQAESFIFQKSTSSSKCFQYATPPLPSLAVLRLSAFMAKICELSKSATKIALKLQIMWQEQSNGKWHGKRGRRGSVEEGGGVSLMTATACSRQRSAAVSNCFSTRHEARLLFLRRVCLLLMRLKGEKGGVLRHKGASSAESRFQLQQVLITKLRQFQRFFGQIIGKLRQVQ